MPWIRNECKLQGGLVAVVVPRKCFFHEPCANTAGQTRAGYDCSQIEGLCPSHQLSTIHDLLLADKAYPLHSSAPGR